MRVISWGAAEIKNCCLAYSSSISSLTGSATRRLWGSSPGVWQKLKTAVWPFRHLSVPWLAWLLWGYNGHRISQSRAFSSCMKAEAGMIICGSFLFVVSFLPPCRWSKHHYPQPHPRPIMHCGPATRGPQEERSNHQDAAFWRRYCTAAKSLWWCPVMLVPIHLVQKTAYYSPYWLPVPARLWSQAELASPSECRLPQCPKSVLLHGPWCSVTALIRTASGKEESSAGTLRLRSQPERAKNSLDIFFFFFLLHYEL